MTKRQIRRAEERRARTLSRKAGDATETATSLQVPFEAPSEMETETLVSAPKPLFTEAKREANRANARLSTGPVTPEGKSASARNNFRHGFTGTFAVLPEEDAEAFNQFQLDLQIEHDPQTPTEDLLVADMARHYWLTQRALRLQDGLLATHDLDEPATQKQLALFMRYQTTNQRAFHRCLNDLLKLRKQRLAEERGFESQNSRAATEARRAKAENRANEMHELNKMLVELRMATEDTRKFNLDFDRMLAAGATDLSAVSKTAVAAA